MKRPTRLNETFPKLPKENGHYICRYCKKVITGRSKNWCSQACVLEAEKRTYPSFAASYLFKQQHGVCQSCGLDTKKIEMILEFYYYLWRDGLKAAQDVLSEMCAELRDKGFNIDTSYSLFGGRLNTLWEMDHIIEFAEGGTLEPDNLQTLCSPCHKLKTAKYVREKRKKKTL